MNIKEKLNDPNLTFEDLDNLLDQAQAEVSFWGGRKVMVQGYEADISIDFLSDLVYSIICRNWDYDETERFRGRNIAAKITQFYSKTDDKIKNSNFFTRFLNFIRELNLNSHTPRWKWEEREIVATKNLFEFYTKNQWLQAFPTQSIPLTSCKIDYFTPDLFNPIDPSMNRPDTFVLRDYTHREEAEFLREFLIKNEKS